MNDQILNQPLAADPYHFGGASGPSPWQVLWQRKAYVALGTVIGLVLGVLYWSMAPKVYESTAQIWVLKKQPDASLTGDMASAAATFNASEDFLSTHRTLIRSAVIVSDAVAKGHLTERAVFRNSKRPAYELARSLTVNRDRDKTAGAANANSQILNISFRCGHPEDCTPVLSAVIASYREYLDRTTQDAATQTLKLIEKAHEVLHNELEAKEKARDEFLRNTPVLWKSQFGTTLNQERLASLDAQRTALNTHVARLRATLNEVEAALKQGRSQAELLAIVSAVPSQAPLMGGGVMRGLRGSPAMEAGGGTTVTSTTIGLEQELIALQLEEGRLLEDFGPEHPRVKGLRDRLQTIRAMLAPSSAPEAQTAEQRDRVTRAKENLVILRIGQLKQELADSERGLKTLEEQYQMEMREARKIFPLQAQEAFLSRAIERSQLLYDTISQRLRELNVVSGSRGFETQVITPPTEVEKIAPRGSLVFPLASFVGLLLGVGFAYLAELTDKSFRSAEDIRRSLGLPIMGIIPVVKVEDKEIVANGQGELQPSPFLVSWHRVSSQEAEAYRGVRTALYFSTHGQGRKVIQVTSPNMGDGKSTLAANLAVSIAQSGKSVLLVDSDLRRPNVGKLFGFSRPAIGFASVLAGLNEPNEAIRQTLVPGLSILPAGPTPPNPAELLTGVRLREAIEWMRERYDYVIIDSPPLLAVTDPGVVGPQVDGVILALRSTKKGRVEAKRAKEILDNLSVTVFGVVLNALEQSRSQEDYGYYGYYRYYEYHDSDANRNGKGQNGRAEHAEQGANRL